jgi:4-amino-4-deoxy-L-arabinose transferase-like glycosyltransferase
MAVGGAEEISSTLCAASASDFCILSLKHMNIFQKRWAPEHLVIFLLAVVTGFRLWYCTYLELVPDEAYYWLWSKHLDASYYSKGPAVAWTIAFGTWVAGDSVFGIRWLSVLLSAGTGWQLFLLARRLFDARVAAAAAVMALVLPLFAIGSILMTIDPLSVFFWIWAANLFWSAIQIPESGKRNWTAWLWVGFAVGCGFLAKFVNALELLCFLLFLAWSPEYRRWLRRPEPLAALGVFFLCTTPVLYWNMSHGWITATHLQERGALDHAFQFRPGEMLQFLQQQALVVSPLLFIGMLAAAFVLWRRKTKTEGERFALSLFLPVFGFYLALSVNDSGQANWTATALVAGMMLAAAYWLRKAEESLAWRRVVLAALGLAFVQTAVLHETKWMNLPPRRDPLNRVRGWEKLADQVESWRRRKNATLIIGDHYQVASILSFYLPGQPSTYTLQGERIRNQFYFWPRYEVKPGTRALFVARSPDRIPVELQKDFPSIILLGEIYSEANGRKIRPYWVYLCLRP